MAQECLQDHHWIKIYGICLFLAVSLTLVTTACLAPADATLPTLASRAAVPTHPSPSSVSSGTNTPDTATIPITHTPPSLQTPVSNSPATIENISVFPTELPAVVGTPLPPYYHQVQEGETLTNIAPNYGLPIDQIIYANAIENPDLIQPGNTIQIPLCEPNQVYIVAKDNTFGGIADLCQVSLDDLALANKERFDLNSLPDFVLIKPGDEVIIPAKSNEPLANCDLQPERNYVIVDYLIQAGEGLVCLSHKFQLSIPTLIQANSGQGPIPGNTYVIPPKEGVLYTLAEADVAGDQQQLPLQLAAWYGVETNKITAWANTDTPIAPPFAAGQQLFIANADLQAGSFQIQWASLSPALLGNLPTDISDSSPNIPPAANDTTSTNAVGSNSGGSASSFIPDYPPMDGAQPIHTIPWIETSFSEYNTGYCPLVDGTGWNGSLAWPVGGRVINDDRSFRPGHAAIDINAEMDTPVFAAQTGVVVWSGFSAYGGGNIVILAHGSGWQTVYMHLNSATAICGQLVSQGALIGYSGKSGGAGWPHLHFAVTLGRYGYDPLRWLP